MSYQNSFRKLVVWQNAKKLVALVYELTKKFPREEVFGLTSQIRRAAVSVCANIAEGNSRVGLKERIQFFNFAKSSLVEVDCLSEISFEQKYFSQKDYNDVLNLINTTAYLLTRFMNSNKKSL
ncbi:four helix bundle protein [Patescibacteria group bacterium]|nr:four helix bundle protein [Patescibacteria group bacterium]